MFHNAWSYRCLVYNRTFPTAVDAFCRKFNETRSCKHSHEVIPLISLIRRRVEVKGYKNYIYQVDSNIIILNETGCVKYYTGCWVVFYTVRYNLCVWYHNKLLRLSCYERGIVIWRILWGCIFCLTVISMVTLLCLLTGRLDSVFLKGVGKYQNFLPVIGLTSFVLHVIFLSYDI